MTQLPATHPARSKVPYADREYVPGRPASAAQLGYLAELGCDPDKIAGMTLKQASEVIRAMVGNKRK